MKNFIFEPEIKALPNLNICPTIAQIESETMLFSSSVDFAYKNGGDITRKVLDSAKDIIAEMQEDCKDTHYLVIDTRSHMLMQGAYPAIGGWHCDAYPRKNTPQPDLRKDIKNNKHFVVSIGDMNRDISCTEYLNSPLAVDYDEDRVWQSINKQVNQEFYERSGFGMMATGPQLERIDQASGVPFIFNQETLHRAVPATGNGWRWFFRMSMYYNPPQNKIRNQVQVYLSPDTSW
jgi:hypothetical protein